MKDDRRLRPFELAPDRRLVEQVDASPRNAVHVTRSVSTRPMPGDGVDPVGSELVEEVAACEAGGAGDKSGGHRERATPFMPPLNGEKLPRPASVNDRKKRWSAGAM